jgi:hypothetical protein
MGLMAVSLLAGGPLDETFTEERDRTYALRWVYLQVVEQYAHHRCHAGLPRERIEGATGE